jgi:hypothetical protein
MMELLEKMLQVATSLPEPQQLLADKIGVSDDLKISVDPGYPEEAGWRKFWLLSNGSLVSVKQTHGKTVREAGVNASKLYNSGAGQGYIKTGELGGAFCKRMTGEQIKTLVSLYNKYYPSSLFVTMGDDSFLSGRIKNAEHLEALLRYGKEFVSESSIDFPQKNLDSSVWDKKGKTYTIKLEVKNKILEIVKRYPDIPLLEIAKEIHVVGSIATNQYLDTADCDIHIIPKNIKDWSEEEVEEVTNWFNKHRDEIDGFIGSHPVEVYIQVEPSQDLMSDGCYDLLNDMWLTGPKIVPMDFDPYEDYSYILDDVKDAVEDADLLFGELKRDVIDYEVIKQAMERMAGENKEKLLKKLQDKLDEMEEDIEALYKERGEWVDKRRKASKPATPEEALEDVKLAKRWKDTNALFKFVNRYHYLKVIKGLKELMADDEITPDEVSKIKTIMGM